MFIVLGLYSRNLKFVFTSICAARPVPRLSRSENSAVGMWLVYENYYASLVRKMALYEILIHVLVLWLLRITMCFPYWWCTKHAKWIKYGQVIPFATLEQTWLPNSSWTPLLILILTKVHGMLTTVMRLIGKELSMLCWTHNKAPYISIVCIITHGAL